MGWVEGIMDWVGLGYENCARGHVCCRHSISDCFCVYVWLISVRRRRRDASSYESNVEHGR